MSSETVRFTAAIYSRSPRRPGGLTAPPPTTPPEAASGGRRRRLQPPAAAAAPRPSRSRLGPRLPSPPPLSSLPLPPPRPSTLLRRHSFAGPDPVPSSPDPGSPGPDPSSPLPPGRRGCCALGGRSCGGTRPRCHRRRSPRSRHPPWAPCSGLLAGPCRRVAGGRRRRCLPRAGSLAFARPPAGSSSLWGPGLALPWPGLRPLLGRRLVPGCPGLRRRLRPLGWPWARGCATAAASSGRGARMAVGHPAPRAALVAVLLGSPEWRHLPSSAMGGMRGKAKALARLRACDGDVRGRRLPC